MGPNSLSTLKFCHNITLLCTLLPSPIWPCKNTKWMIVMEFKNLMV
jgi:hypothetical protein